MAALVSFFLFVFLVFLVRGIINNKPFSPVRFYRVTKLWFLNFDLTELRFEWYKYIEETRLHLCDQYDGEELQIMLNHLYDYDAKAKALFEEYQRMITDKVAEVAEEKRILP